MVKPFPAGLDVLLATKSYYFVDLYQFALSDGATFLRYTTADADVSYNGSTWTSKGPFFDSIQSKSTAHWKTGLDVDTWTVVVAPLATDPVTGAAFPNTIYGQPWLQAVRAGALDGAVVDVHRAYWASVPTWPVAAPGKLVPTYVLADLFAGRVAAVDLTRTEAFVSINSHIEVLTRQMPKNVWQPGCRHTLFDVGCTLARASFAFAGTVGAVATNGQFNTNLAQADGYFSLGSLTWLTGGNVGFSRSIRNYLSASGAVTLLAPMPFAVQTGDTFTAYAGCDKQLSTCTNKFANAVNFGGEPYIPAPELAI